MDVLENVDMSKFKDWLRNSDGYDIVGPEFFTKMGFSEKLMTAHTDRHYSGEGKYGITTKGKPVKYVDGVYELTFLHDLANRLGADTSKADMLYGRGSSYRALIAAVLTQLEEIRDDV